MNVIDHPFDVVVIGAGQAGLACGWHLKQQGLDFLILDEQQQPGGNWRNYYDSLELFSPAAYSSLPGLPFPGEPGHYPSRDEVVRYLEQYASFFQLPIIPGIQVIKVDQERAIPAMQPASDKPEGWRIDVQQVTFGADVSPNSFQRVVGGQIL